MKFVLLVYQGSTPVPGSDRWEALSEAAKKAIYADYAALNNTEGVVPGLPLGLPDAARTVQVKDCWVARGAPNWSLAVAVNCRVVPVVTVAFAGLRVMLFSV